ncbi:MAG TPA: 4Fe-4S single cluster domain-containing protein [Conexibacter sp.]|jgi:anaerobic ribonucleoside-triphosphate reductase activating protein
MMPPIRLHRFVGHTRAEGPGTRACLWVQGCSIRCAGCFNTHMWDADGGHAFAAGALTERIVGTSGIEGVTFLGGEPFEQAAALASLARRVRAEGLSVMTFTGYRYERLAAADADPDGHALLAATDLLVDGPYDFRRPDSVRPWVGSTNQRFWFLSDRYAALANRLHLLPDRLEVRLRPDGTVFVNGMARRDQLVAMRREVVG